ncbi:DDE-type integrase/transposase/recombinase [Mariprofundus sp. KV]|uniref:DDE-type integrase/transposase/recombinase n=1 Tax=Mariprofundus sp. KV TaxID=2608715 RepID=UPI0019D66B1D|nr:DDE-type integrase/transposase/recombinase [Mariprofundus sp. KV]
MDERKIKTVADISALLAGTDQADLKLQGSKDDIYAWVERTLNRLRYGRLSKKEKGQVLRYLIQLSGYSRQQITRLITRHRETGHIHRRQRTTNGFKPKFTREDIILLAEVDQLVDSASGTTIKVYCQRAYELFGDQRFARLANISVSHLYNLRANNIYRRCRRVYTKTNPVQVPIGERRKPRPDGQPGYLRIDSVHQGDMDKKKGVYHINAVDEVTQWEVVVTVQRIQEEFTIPALKSLLKQIPFEVKGFHSDNGSEYINRYVAELLNKQMIRMTKSRSRHCNDNALAESKNGAVVRKAFGRVHIPQLHAELIDSFNRKHLNPCLNYHRPCHFPSIETDAKGKQKKRYRVEDMMTPYEKLKSLKNAEQYLKPNLSFQWLDTIAKRYSDLDAWRQLRNARRILFKTIFGQNNEAA